MTLAILLTLLFSLLIAAASTQDRGCGVITYKQGPDFQLKPWENIEDLWKDKLRLSEDRQCHTLEHKFWYWEVYGACSCWLYL
jgi:hypothetical protein